MRDFNGVIVSRPILCPKNLKRSVIYRGLPSDFRSEVFYDCSKTVKISSLFVIA